MSTGASTSDPDGDVAITAEDSGITKLFAVLLAGEYAAFGRLISESRMAPDVASRVAIARMIASEVRHYGDLAEHIEARGIDSAGAVERYSPIFDQYHRATTPTNWYEVLVKAYVGDGLATDFYTELAGVLPEHAQTLLADVMGQTAQSEFACEQVRAAVTRDPNLKSPLVLWGRRLLGEAITHAQWVLAAEEEVTDLLFSGAASLQGVASFFENVEESHNVRMAALGLA